METRCLEFVFEGREQPGGFRQIVPDVGPEVWRKCERHELLRLRRWSLSMRLSGEGNVGETSERRQGAQKGLPSAWIPYLTELTKSGESGKGCKGATVRGSHGFTHV